MVTKERIVQRTRVVTGTRAGLVLCLLWIAGCGDWTPIEEYKPLPASAKHKGKSLDEWVELLSSEERSVRIEAVKAVARYGPNAPQAVPRLVELIDDEDPIPTYAVRALARAGPEAGAAVPRLNALIDERADLAESAVWALGEMGPAGKDAVAVLCELLRGRAETTMVMATAAEALGSIRLLPETSVPCLADTVAHYKVPSVQAQALQALGKFGGDAMPAIAVVKTASNHKAPEIRAAARYAKRVIEGSRALKEWVQLLDSTNDWQRKCAFAALQYWGARSAPAVPKLTRLAERPSRWQVDAIRTLGAVGREAAQAVPGLISALSSPDNEVRAAAAEALGRIGTPGESGEVVEALEEAADDEDPEVKERAEKALECLKE